FSPDGSVVAAGSEDKTIILWDVETGRSLGALEGHSDTVSSLLFENDGDALLSGSFDGTIIRWDLENMKPLATLIKGFGASVSSIFPSPDGHLTALALDK